MAYVLKPGENAPPTGLQRAFDQAVAIRRMILDVVRPGVTAGDALAAVNKRVAQAPGLVLGRYDDPSKDLRVSDGTWIKAVGISGYVAKGLVLAGAGLLVIVATLQADPSKAAGLDAAVKTLGQAPFGKFLLIFAALVIAAFGVYNFVRGRYGRM